MELSKEELRRHFLSRLRIGEKERDEASARVVKNLSVLLSRAKGPVAAFRAFDSEPILKALVTSLNLDWVFPKVEGETLSFYRATWDELMPGAYQAFEPPADASRKVALEELGWVLVPGVSFDRQGVRLGRGKGFYDKTLFNFDGVRVGVCFAEGISNSNLPCEDHDLKVDWLVSDRFVMRALAN